jgi:hypothetical protein
MLQVPHFKAVLAFILRGLKKASQLSTLALCAKQFSLQVLLNWASLNSSHTF